MPQQLFYPNEGLIVVTTALVQGISNMTLHLFKSGYSPTITVTQADLEEQEADYTGYAAALVENWNGPFLAPEGGFAIVSPTISFTMGNPVVVPNLIGGYWLEDENGKVLVCCEFAEPQPMQVRYQQIQIGIRLVYPN